MRHHRIFSFDSELIDESKMTKEELTWFNEYQAMVFEKISPCLATNEKAWLENKTKVILVNN